MQRSPHSQADVPLALLLPYGQQARIQCMPSQVVEQICKAPASGTRMWRCGATHAQATGRRAWAACVGRQITCGHQTGCTGSLKPVACPWHAAAAHALTTTCSVQLAVRQQPEVVGLSAAPRVIDAAPGPGAAGHGIQSHEACRPRVHTCEGVRLSCALLNGRT